MRHLPEGWIEVPLGDIGEWYGGGTPSKSNPDYWTGGSIPWLSPKDMGEDVLHETKDRITEKAVAESPVRLVPEGSVAIVVRSGILERTLPVGLIPFATTLNQDMKAVHPGPDVLPEWVAWGIRAGGADLLNAVRKSGTTVASIETSRLMSTCIPIPPLDEQKRVVAILEDHLSRLDSAVDGVERAMQMAPALRHAVFKAAFEGQLVAADGFWVEATLSDVAVWSSGGTPTSSNARYYGGEIPWVVIGDLTESWVDGTEKCITAEGLEKSAARMMPAETVMLAMYGASIGRTGKMAVPMATNQAIACAVVRREVMDPDFLLYYLQSQKPDFVSAGQGGAQPNISQRIVKAWPIRYPPLADQRRIVEALDESIERLRGVGQDMESIGRQAATFRRSLLVSAFSGQLTKEASLV